MGKSKGSFGQDLGPAPEGSGAPAPLPVNPIVAAAQAALVDLFDTLAKDWPARINTGLGPDAPTPPFTKDMLALLNAQLRRALGVDDPGSKT